MFTALFGGPSRREELNNRGWDVAGVVVRTWTRNRRIEGDWYKRPYAEVAFTTHWGPRSVTLKGSFQVGQVVWLRYDEDGAVRLPE